MSTTRKIEAALASLGPNGGAVVLIYFAVKPTTLGVEGYGIDFVPSTAVALHTLVASLLRHSAPSSTCHSMKSRFMHQR